MGAIRKSQIGADGNIKAMKLSVGKENLGGSSQNSEDRSQNAG
jgi:hypothetical protein